MQVITDLNTFKPNKPTVVTQGTFDGVHVGHQLILSKIVKIAQDKKGTSVLVTFHPHPRHVLYNSDKNLQLLTNFDEKTELLEAIGIDYLVVLAFNEELSKMDPSEFVRDILVEKIGVSTMVVGYDHRFGKNREGSFEDLKEYAHMFNFEVIEIAAHDIEEATVSSTKIRKCISEGDLITAAAFLGRNYSLRGTVVEGRKMGKALGYPTANISVKEEEKLIPANGIYAVRVKHKSILYNGMLSIGNNPTFEDAKWSIEVHIFDFNAEIYGEELEIIFVKKLRNEIKFESLEGLKNQLSEDSVNSKIILGEERLNNETAAP